jgi:hypothetical protein
VIRMLYATLANCSCNYRIHLMRVIHCVTPPLMFRYFAVVRTKPPPRADYNCRSN